MNMRAARLYTLSDPETPGVIRYVGWTSKTTMRRLSGHITEARQMNHRHHRACCIRSLLSDGKTPVMRTVALVEVKDAPSMERRYIAALRSSGVRLVNSTDGGEGVANPTPDVREKIRAAALLRPKPGPEAIEKMAAAIRGKKRRPEWVAAIAAANRGLKRSPEHCARMAAIRLGGKHTPESRANMSAAQRGRRMRELESMGPKRCTRCGSLGPFHKSSRSIVDGFTSRCKECENAQIKLAKRRRKNGNL